MKSRYIRNRPAAAALAATLTLIGVPAHAHCDQVDGPVVNDARAALNAGDVTEVLKWIPAEGEEELREAFDQTLAVRGESPEARELADRYFFETVVRIHRASEGAAFTGLKPADTPVSPAIERTDAALASGSVDELATDIADAVEQSIRTQYAATMEARADRDESVEAGREFVAQYVPFVHYVKRIHDTVNQGPQPLGQDVESH
jgi:hypothetical protein